MGQRIIKDERVNEVNEQQQNAAVEQPSQIFKLNIDCFEKLFDYLSFEDLHSMGQTCKRMERVTCHFYQQQFGYAECYPAWKSYSDWYKYQRRVCLDGNSTIDDICNRLNKFESAKQIDFAYFELKSFNVVPSLEKALNQIEHVSFDCCEMNEPLFDGILGLCTNIKSLKIDYDNTHWFEEIYVEWLTKKFPKLEQFSWNPRYLREVHNLQTFFQQNPTIRSFLTRSSFLSYNKNTIRKIKLDDIFIKWDNPESKDSYEFLNKLHAEGVYKRLHIASGQFSQTVIERLSSLDYLTGFFLIYQVEEVDLSPLKNLKVLGINDTRNITNIPGTAQSLKNLIEVRFRRARMDDILPFIHMSAKLEKMIIKEMESLNQALDPVAMNREREQLLAKTLYVNKVMIYIPQPNYLATKWYATEMDLKLIEIRRYESEDLSTMFDLE